MKFPVLTAIVATLAFGASAFASCDYPRAPRDLPTGKTESKEEMLEAQKRVKDYVASMEAYLQCLDNELTAMGEAVTDEHRVIRDKRHNAAVDAMDQVAANFNTAVRAYKARQ